ncbi:hypothetical protein RRG08_059546, partial [Elysia crispata]
WIDGFSCGTDLTLVKNWTATSSSGRMVLGHINFKKPDVQVVLWFLVRWIDGFSCGTDLTLVQSWTAISSVGRMVVAHMNFYNSGVQVD